MYLGIEIGGTKLQLGVGMGDGLIKGLWRGQVDPQAGADGIRNQIEQALPELLEQAHLTARDLQAVGIGFGGPIDDSNHTVIKSHQIPGWDDFPLAHWFAEMLELPAYLGNDADVAGLAEAHFGAGQGLSPILYITLGSGIGGGLIVEGEIYRGLGRGAAEIGHLRIPLKPQKRGVQMVPLESIASGWGIEEFARREQEMSEGKEAVWREIQGDEPTITVPQIARAAQAGNGTAWCVLYTAWECLAEAICHAVTLLAPRRIVIGGGVANLGEELLFGPLRRLVEPRVFRPFAGTFDIQPAALGEEVVVHGALALAHHKHHG